MRAEESQGKSFYDLKAAVHRRDSPTLLDFLCRRFRYFSREQWRARIEQGKIFVNEKPARPDQVLGPRDWVSYRTSAWVEPEVKTDYRVLLEDECLLAVSKPAPLPVHSVGRYFQNTLMALLRKERGREATLKLVHRLDSETSGVVLLAKHPRWLKSLQRDWAEGRVRKEYAALVFGCFPKEVRRVEAPLALGSGRVRIRARVDLVRGKSAVTEFEAHAWKKEVSWIWARPLTGRTHQIRAHLEALHHPIVGDKLYSGSEETFLHFRRFGWTPWLEERVWLRRSALHLTRLVFPHPAAKKEVVVEDPLPEDLKRFWKNLPTA